MKGAKTETDGQSVPRRRPCPDGKIIKIPVRLYPHASRADGCGAGAIKLVIAAGLHVNYDMPPRRVRGLLCYRCNLGIGHPDDGPDLLDRAADYLRKA